MTESTMPRHPKPEGLEVDALNDAAWDLRDCSEAYLHGETDIEKWLHWLRRYEGFGEDEVRAETVKSFAGDPAIHLILGD